MTSSFSKALLLLLTCTGLGCQSTASLQRTAIAEFEAGRPLQTITALQEAEQKRNAETQILEADLAIAELMAGQPQQAGLRLRKVKEELDFLSQKDFGEQALSVVADSRTISYSGREFEKAMIRNLLTLASLLSDRQDAFAYSGQAMEIANADFQELQTPAIQPSESSETLTVSHQSTVAPQPPEGPARQAGHALAAYLSAVIHSENAMDRQLARTSLTRMTTWSNALAAANESTLGTLTPPNHGGVHVITFTDRITDWVPENAVPTSAALLLADQILSAAGDYSLPPTIAPVKIGRPAASASANPFVTAIVLDNQNHVLPGATLIDLNAAAHDSHLAKRDHELAAAVARRIVKKAAVYTAKDQISVEGGSEVDTLLSVGGIIWESLEKPDTRHLSLLPAQIEVTSATLPVGQHQIRLMAVPEAQTNKSQPPSTPIPAIPVNIQNGRNSVILCFRIGRRFVGHVLVDGEAIPLNE